MTSRSFYAVIAGVGSGTGRATALKFSQTYPVVLLSRRAESYNDIVNEIKQNGGQAYGVSADVGDPASLKSAFKSVGEQFPGSKLAAAVYNVNTRFFKKPFLELTRDEFQAGLDGAAGAFFTFAQQTLPLLLEAVPDSPHPPTMILTGATAAMKGSAEFGSLAAGKFALRALSQSLAREFGPQGVHVAHAIIDGIIDTPATKAWGGDSVQDSKIQPEDIADSYWYLHTQRRSAFTQEIDLRPYAEKF